MWWPGRSRSAPGGDPTARRGWPSSASRARTTPTYAFAGRLVHAGELGAGAALKLAHNVMVYLGYLAALEAVELARGAGVADGLVEEVTRASGTLSPQTAVWLEIYERRRVDGGGPDEQAAFATYAALLEKDLGHAVEVAEGIRLDLPATRLLSRRGDEVYAVRRDPPVPTAS